jgi:type IV secretion system protein VirB7
MMRLFISLLFLNILMGCSKPPDLEAPCREFGKHCSQQPINTAPIEENP